MSGCGGCAQPETQLFKSIKKCARQTPPPPHFGLDQWTTYLEQVHVPYFWSSPPPLHKKEKLKKDKWLINFIYLLSHTGTCKFLHTAKVIYWVLLGNMERGGGHDPELKAI